MTYRRPLGRSAASWTLIELLATQRLPCHSAFSRCPKPLAIRRHHCGLQPSRTLGALLIARRPLGQSGLSWTRGTLLAARPISQLGRTQMDGWGFVHWIQSSGVLRIRTLRVCPGLLDMRCPSEVAEKTHGGMKGAKWAGGRRTTKRVPDTQYGTEQSGMRLQAMGRERRATRGRERPRPVLGALSGLNRQKGTENRKERADHPGRRQTARRANIWRERPNSEDGVEWEVGRLLTWRDSSDRKSAEQLGGRRMA